MFLTVQYGTDANPGENIIAMRETDVLFVPEFRIIIDKWGWNYMFYVAMFCDPIGPYSKLPLEKRDRRVSAAIANYPYKKSDNPIRTDGFYLEKKYFLAAEAAYREVVRNEHFDAFGNVSNTIHNLSRKLYELNEMASNPKAGLEESKNALIDSVELSMMLDKLMSHRDKLEGIIFKSIRDKKGETVKTGLGSILSQFKNH